MENEIYFGAQETGGEFGGKGINRNQTTGVKTSLADRLDGG